MQFTTTMLATLLTASSVFAAPTASAQWTLTDLKRVCNTPDTSCTWSFGINPNTAGVAVTPCSFNITGTPASHSDLTTAKTCGVYNVTAGWSGQFGAGNGFTTLAVFNTANKQIAWPAYTDTELAGGKVVSPNKSWAIAQM